MPEKTRPPVDVATVWIGLLVVLVLVGAAGAGADEVLEWNVAGFEISGAGGQNPILQSRTLSMVHLAIHDALNAIDPRYEPYFYEGRAEPGAAPGAAAAAAARGVLAGVIPVSARRSSGPKRRACWRARTRRPSRQSPRGPPRRKASRSARPPPPPRLPRARTTSPWPLSSTRSVELIPGSGGPPRIPSRQTHRWRALRMAAGNLPAMLPHWGSVTPFTMATPWQFRLPGPPSLASEQYARDYAEVQRLGGKASQARSAVQAEIAKYWYEASPQGWSRIARVISVQRGLDRWANARLLALVNAVIADGFIAGADTRYLFNFWRPVTAIRGGRRSRPELVVELRLKEGSSFAATTEQVKKMESRPREGRGRPLLHRVHGRRPAALLSLARSGAAQPGLCGLHRHDGGHGGA